MNVLNVMIMDYEIKILDILAKGTGLFENSTGNIACAVSGGSDSDIVIDILSKLQTDKQVLYMFYDTGIEYTATKQHLKYLEDRYNIKIQRILPKKAVPKSTIEYGEPFLSKYVSEMIYRLQQHNFQWKNESFEILYKKYPKCKIALMWWCNANGTKSSFNISKNYLLKEFMIQNPPTFKISNKCCTYAKKIPYHKYCKENNVKLLINGIRQSEGGIRSQVYKTCFSEKDDIITWRPIFWLNDEDKLKYKIENNIIYSDCYEKYNLKRTGCFGCPFGSKFEFELQQIELFEPKLWDRANSIFKNSYKYTREYRAFKGKGEQLCF